MPEKLKEILDEEMIRSLGRDLRRAHPGLRMRSFVAQCRDGLEELELTERAWQIADTMRAHLPDRFEESAAILLDSLGPELDRTEEFGLEPLRYLPHVFFVQKGQIFPLIDFDVLA